MIKSEQASISVTRIAIITIITIFALSFGVLAASTEVRNVKIVLSDNCEIEVLTTKTKVEDILEENKIVVLPEENVVPNLDSEITSNHSKIIITGKTQDAAVVAALAEESEGIYLDQLLGAYNTVVEKIIVEEEEIPYETITKDSTNSSSGTTSVIQEGKMGLKRTTYKVKYQNDIEIERTVIKEEIIKEAVNKIIQTSNVTTRKSTKGSRTANSTPVTTKSGNTLASKVSGKTPVKKTLNASAYTASTCGKSPSSPSYGITSSGARATAWYTVAAGKGYPIGTIIYIPYFSSQPNGGWFVVQDRGGAISNNKLDIYMNTYNECISFGRRNLECYIYEV
ncbi:MAG: hypothetical protein HFJ54_07090 [Clostridia bacterium]|nr:hypothetical protein [Clostridia bacterium]